MTAESMLSKRPVLRFTVALLFLRTDIIMKKLWAHKGIGTFQSAPHISPEYHFPYFQYLLNMYFLNLQLKSQHLQKGKTYS